MAGSEQYAGISVPEGSASQLERLSSDFAGMAGSFEGAAMRLHGLPSQVSSWHGPGSVEFAASAHRQGDACHRAAVAFAHARDAARHFAHELHDAQHRARRAIEDARDAQHRIDEAHDEIVDAQQRIDAARVQEQAAATVVSNPASLGGPLMSALSDQQAAQAAQATAEADLRRAERKRDRARDDLDTAKADGRRAADDARDAQTRVSAAFSEISSYVPLPAGLGAPAGAVRGGGSRPAIDPGLLGHGRAGTNGLPVATAGALPAGLLPAGLDSGDAAKFGTPLTVVGGVGAGLTMHAIVQYYRHAVRRVESLSPGVWGDVVPSTRSGREALTVSRLRAARNLEGLGKPLNPLKTFGKASIVLEPISAYATFKGNEGHMSTAENVTRTGFSTAGGIVFGGLAGGLCAMSGVGTIATGGCGALGAIGGSWLGDKTGAVAYDVGDFAYSDVAKPVWNGGVKPAWNATGGALIHAVGG